MNVCCTDAGLALVEMIINNTILAMLALLSEANADYVIGFTKTLMLNINVEQLC